eukprot:403346480
MIAGTEENKDINKIALCGICYQVVTENRKPLECDSCHNSLFCTPCIQKWSKSKSTCPFCHANKAQYVEISPILMKMIKQMKFFCKNKNAGCTFTETSDQLLKHEHECEFGQNRVSREAPILKVCQFCNQAPSYQEHNQYQPLSDSDRDFDHICDKLAQKLCFDHKLFALKYEEARIANLDETEMYYEFFKCNICNNLLKQAKTCTSCQKNFCQYCISNSLIQSNICPSCYIQSPTYENISRNLQSLLNKFKIYCKNSQKGCSKIIPYDNVEQHESNCLNCENCFVNCSNCRRPYKSSEHLQHQCPQIPIPQAQTQRALLLAINRQNDNYSQLSDNMQQRRAPGYCKNIKQDTVAMISKCPIGLTIPVMIIDFFLQNLMIVLYIMYLINEDFVYEPLNKPFYFFFFLYIGAGYFPIGWLIQNDYTNTRGRVGCVNKKFIEKIPLLLLSLIRAEYLYIIFGPLKRRNLDYLFKDSVRVSHLIRSICQMIIQITLVTVMGLNNADDLIKGLACGFSIFQFFFNILFTVTILKK